jgi:predicted nucleic acid-binding protein
MTRYPPGLPLPRVRELRHDLTAYGAAWVTLAEALGAPLVARDRRLADAPGHQARVELA